jgi:hypothetical protein
MSVNFLQRRRNRFPTKKELFDVDLRVREATQSCPTASQLRSFAMGEYIKEDPTYQELREHLADCDRCIAILTKIRLPRNRQARTLGFLRRKQSLVALAAALIFGAISFWAFHDRTSSTSVTVDLRQVMRGDQSLPIALPRQATAIRVLLPAGSAIGDYDLAFFALEARMTPILVGSGRANPENGDLVLAVPISLKALSPGPYLLGIRHTGDWKQYAVTVN